MSASAAAPPVRRLTGHHAAILCCKLQAGNQTAVSGGEDGAVCLYDLRTGRSVHRLVVADDGIAVPSLALHPRQPHTVLAACGNAVHAIDLRQVLACVSIILCVNVVYVQQGRLILLPCPEGVHQKCFLVAALSFQLNKNYQDAAQGAPRPAARARLRCSAMRQTATR